MAATEAQLRILLQDAAGANEILTTEDYTALISVESNVYRAAALAARTISAKFADRVQTTVGPLRMDLQQVFQNYLDLADKFDDRANEGGGDGDEIPSNIVGGGDSTGTSISTNRSNRRDPDRYNGAFPRGFQDNPPSERVDADFSRGEYYDEGAYY